MRSQLNKMLLGAFAAAALLVTQSVHAQQVPGRTAATMGPSAPAATYQAPKPAKAEWIVSKQSELVRIPLNKVITVRLAGPVQNVVIADPTVADIILPEDGNRTHVYLLARAVGSTAIIFEDGNGNILFQGDVQVDVDVTGIQAAINELMPDDRIQITSQRNGVFVKGFVRSAGASAQAVEIARRFVPDSLNVINNLEVLGSRQVVMQVRVSEMKRTAIKQLGFDFTYTLDFGTSSIGVTSAGATNLKTVADAAGLPAAFATGNIIPTIAGFGNIAYRIMEENGLAKTLAEPALTAISGETATFLAGGTFPMLTVIDKDGNKTYTQTPFGVRLSFTPTVMDNGQISLHVATEVSDRDTTVAVDGIPGLKLNRTETVVDLPSGGSLIISGLIQNELINTIDGIPGLKDVPILGTLFRSEGFRNKETELVVTVTAYLAEPVGNDARLALPSDGFAAPGDLDMYLLGHLHKQYAKTELPPYATPLAGPYGYIME